MDIDPRTNPNPIAPQALRNRQSAGPQELEHENSERLRSLAPASRANPTFPLLLLLLLAAIGLAVASCTGSRDPGAALVPPEPPASPAADEVAGPPEPVISSSFAAIHAEAEQEVPPPPPDFESPTFEELGSVERGASPSDDAPLPKHSAEQDLQEVAESHSETSRELGRSHEPVYVIDDLLFESGSARLESSVRSTLDRLVERLRLGDLDYVLEIRGHTDSTGAEPLNQRLAELRARAVRDHLRLVGGVPEDRLVTVAFGEQLPIADDSHPGSFSRNRRVTVRVLVERAESAPSQE